MIPRRVLGLGEQLAYLRLRWPDFQCHIWNGALTATGNLQPSEISETYTVQVSQRGGRSPQVRVLAPDLRPGTDGQRIPHMYSQERLCLFLPGSGEWKLSDPIAYTIIPWTSMWLYFYEVWHATDEWHGGGVDVDIPITIRKAGYDRHRSM